MGSRQEQVLKTRLWFSTVTENEFGQMGIEQDLQVLHHLHLKREVEHSVLSQASSIFHELDLNTGIQWS